MALEKQEGVRSLKGKLEAALQPIISDLGYELVIAEVSYQSSKEATLIRLFIDHSDCDSEKTIAIEDCIRVDKGLAEFLDSPTFESIFNEEFTLEVSSPGMDRPLRTPDHFQRFQGEKVQVKTFRPLKKEELKNEEYFQKYPKQKNFKGNIDGVEKEDLLLKTENEQIKIPFSLIAKANLDVSKDYLETIKKQ